jgi:hypothetical protein
VHPFGALCIHSRLICYHLPQASEGNDPKRLGGCQSSVKRDRHASERPIHFLVNKPIADLSLEELSLRKPI